MTDVEVLGYIGGRVLDDDFLSLPRVIAPIIELASGRVLGRVVNLGQHFLKQSRRSTGEVKESLFLSDGFDPFVWFELEGVGITEWTVRMDERREVRQGNSRFRRHSCPGHPAFRVT